MPTEFCPDCEMPIRIAIPWIGQRVACPYCSVSLLVTDVTPLEFYWADNKPPVVLKGGGKSTITRASRR